jgi:hypothetical protein
MNSKKGVLYVMSIYSEDNISKFDNLFLEHSGVKGQKWYHRYHQSYKSKPTRSGKVGTEHMIPYKKIYKHINDENKSLKKERKDILQRYKDNRITKEEYDSKIKKNKNDSRINKQIKRRVDKNTSREWLRDLFMKNGYGAANNAAKTLPIYYKNYVKKNRNISYDDLYKIVNKVMSKRR